MKLLINDILGEYGFFENELKTNTNIAVMNAGLFFGCLYWRKGLEAAFIGHIFAHVTMIVGEKII